MSLFLLGNISKCVNAAAISELLYLGVIFDTHG